jgi:hypothetical protein
MRRDCSAEQNRSLSEDVRRSFRPWIAGLESPGGFVTTVTGDGSTSPTGHPVQ